jgi:dihydrofolate synthase/folylpolyglutamate synthase
MFDHLVNPLIILDGAHNSESIDALIDTIKQYHDKEKVDILFSAINGKPINEMVKHLFYVVIY